ncbi:hypothetical protein SAMN05421786_10851 [Chryseobacterium ureilyticum]|uniref:DUF4440 domain-containing protein n=1 Tax=Chryseobacterium ureilyticum TaxID=373668 RepID=A0A1N7Q8I9_9FLAO|nr:hypothetical protein [Chryseobacterium ureilyticum]SIT19170.1 hypothetical protein SAMN05421786_10851 [Chryseobacterium ureilyticum]
MNNTEKITKELNEFCENIEKWFRGNEKDQEALLKKILSGFSPDFKMINGDGNTATLSMFSEWLPSVFGKFPERSVQIENIQIHHSEHHGLATYTEIQTTEGITNKRKSSAIFVLNAEKALWFHLVEDWI